MSIKKIRIDFCGTGEQIAEMISETDSLTLDLDQDFGNGRYIMTPAFNGLILTAVFVDYLSDEEIVR